MPKKQLQENIQIVWNSGSYSDAEIDFMLVSAFKTLILEEEILAFFKEAKGRKSKLSSSN